MIELDVQTLYIAQANGRLLDPDVAVPLIDLPPLNLPPLRTHEQFMRQHVFAEWLHDWIGRDITDDELRRFRRRERDRARRARG